jgi:hypothetical protein
MNVRSFTLAAVTLIAISPAFADAPKAAPADPRPAVREQTVLEELAAGMREILRAVVPEISLPALEIKLPTLNGDVR